MSRSTKTDPSGVNGIDTAKLHGTIEAVSNDPSLGAFEFRASNRWLGGTHNRTQVGSFRGAGAEHGDRSYTMDCGEPPVLCGNEEAANPVEHLLNALAGCVTTTMAAHAAARGIEIESIESELNGDIDVRGFLGLANDVPKGYRGIRIRFRVRSDADEKTLAQLAAFSPVYNTITQPTPVTIEIVKA